VIDARDLAAFTLGLVERDVAGTFNACSPPGRFAFRDLVDACLASATSPPAPAWIDEATLAAHHVEPWTGLPLWIPATEPDAAGFMTIDTSRAEREGLAARPLAETVRDTAAWLPERDNAGAWKLVLSDARERLVLSAAGG
jgi:2'-hydroxyisoflavone reductase